MGEENKYPCKECKEENSCEEQKKYLRCFAWLDWFYQQWENIRKLFAFNVSNRHEKKGGDDK